MAALSLAFDVVANDRNASRTLNNVGDAADRAGRAGRGFGNAMRAGIAGAVGALATLGLGAAFKTFIEEANEAAKVGRLTNAVLTSTGGAANVTADQVSDLAEALSVKAAVDDELVQSGANVLLTFTKIRNEAGKGNDIFNQAAEAALNMSAALGTDLQAASIQVGKALNDPIKGVTALGRAGVQFTQQQKDQIKTLVESGNTLGAQKIILAEFNTQFAGAAEAAASPLDRLKVSAGNLGEAIGGVLLPGATRLAEYLTANVIPAVQAMVEDFAAGEGRIGAIKNTVITFKDAAVGLYNILFKGDYTGGIFGLQEDSPVIDYLFRFRDAIIDVGSYLKQLWTDGKAAADVLATGLKPVWDELVAVWNSDLKPAFQELFRVLQDELGPIFGHTAEEQGPFLKNLAEMTVSLVKYLLPALVQGIKNFALFVRAVAAMVAPMVAAWQWASRLALGFTTLTVQAQLMVRQTVSGVQMLGATVVSRFNAIRTGVASAIGGAIATVRGIPGQITGAVGNLGSLLTRQGRAIISGLISGVRSGIAELRATFSSITNMIPDWKGPMERDKTLLAPSGAAIMRGLMTGVESQVPALRGLMGRVTEEFSMPTGPAPVAATGRPIVITLDGRVIADSTSGYQQSDLYADVL